MEVWREEKNNSVYPSELHEDLRELVIVSLVAERIFPAYHNTTFPVSSSSAVLIYICVCYFSSDVTFAFGLAT